ncbi:RHS repeat-associated core domain-containing protein, partial [Pseudomonas sp. 1D4]|uniref:RHS repeat-associated core domain-containing protein n=3 Tax=Pseudomonadaceae TaxID=135621 RepID=UPI000AF7B715
KSKASYYVWLDDLPIAQIDLAYNFAGTVVDSTTLTYLHSDHLNTPRLATNQSGNLVWSWQSDAFGIGQPKTHGSTIDVILRFPGQIADAHSGLYYNYFRDYDPETGRYVESDPIGLNGGLNTYGYVRGNPLTRIDPYGLVEAVCMPEDFGCGYDENGNKQCKYTCTSGGNTSTGILGGSQNLSQGDICYGYEVRQIVAPSGDVTTNAGPASKFTVDTENFWDRYFNYDPVLLDNIDKKFKENSR